ncbi:unnamed protein product [Haemonchus placei]|uniref:Mlh1_C domain-containing protein n=1 Tax=Haemonchus placei TaxID=6290 RepID=A0A0N4WQ53_HAEPC|nr:unnamed protein product [Haemonchus placei]
MFESPLKQAVPFMVWYFGSMKPIPRNSPWKKSPGMGEEKVQWLPVVRDQLVPRIKSHLLPPKSLSDAVVCLADLHDLYKVFERC